MFPPHAMTPLTRRDIQDQVMGLRFQPVVNLCSEVTEGWEILTWLRDEDPEVWFPSLSVKTSMAIFMWQLNEAIKNEGLFWLNLPVKVLINPLCIAEICKLDHYRKIIIEIQDPENIFTQDFIGQQSLASGIHVLREAGWQVWLDDITEELSKKLTDYVIPVDGIKIDKAEINKKDEFKELINRVKITSEYMIVEGIETYAHYLRARNQGAQLGQGFLWAERKVRMAIPDYYLSDIKSFRSQPSQFSSCNIFLDCDNQYLKEGLHFLLWELVKSTRDECRDKPVRLVTDEKNASIIISQKKTGETPVDCSAYINGFNNRQMSQIRILICKENERYQESRCPGIHFALDINDEIHVFRKAISKAIAQIRGTVPLPEVRPLCVRCRLCLRYRLTQREKEIIDLMADGQSLDTIAQKYGCARKVIGGHKRAFMRKLAIRNNIELYLYLYRLSDVSTTM